MHRKKLDHQQMIKQLKDKGITFNNISETEAKNFLENNNYYYKVTAYRKNFEKVDGQYIDLDFSYLIDLSTIDMRLRYHIMKVALDIEHSIKTLMLKTITNNPLEDGYSIVDDFKKFDTNNHRKTVQIFKRSEYLSDMYQKRGQNIPAWVFVEIMDYGTLSKFIDFYRLRYKAPNFRIAHKLLPYSKHLRNLAAHSNTLLINIYGDKNLLRDRHNKVRIPSAQIVSFADSFDINRQDVKFNKIHDLVALATLHKKYTSPAIQHYRKLEFSEILDRIDRNSDYYSNNIELTKFFKLLSKLNA